MKRLLAYLFIILGLGLTFNVNAYEIYKIFTEAALPYEEDNYRKSAASASKGSWKKSLNIIDYKSFRRMLADRMETAIYRCEKAAIRNNLKSENCSVRRVSINYYVKDITRISGKRSGVLSYRDTGVLSYKDLSLETFDQTVIEIWKDVELAFLPDKKKDQDIIIVDQNKITEEKKKIAEEKRKIEEEKRKKAAAKKKKEEEEQKRIAEAKKKEEDEQKYRILVRKYGDDCKDNSLGSPEFNKCLKDVEAEDLLQAKLQREFLASLTPEEARAYTCNNTFGFRKGSSNFKDCIFKLYTTELELEKLDLEKQLALAKVEAEKAKADTARAQVEIIQARSAAARAEGKLQEAQIQATKAQTLSMQQQAAASRQQAAAAQAQARAAQQQNSLNLMTQGLKMLSGNQSSSSRLRTNCSWSSIGISCR
jgi:hypothetical protein